MMQNAARRLLPSTNNNRSGVAAVHGASSMKHHHHLTNMAMSLMPLQYNTIFTASRFASAIHLPISTSTTTLTKQFCQALSFSTNIERESSSSFQQQQQFQDDNDNRDVDLSNMSNEELCDTSTIPGWDLIHCPPRTFPRGALVGTVVSDKMQKTINVAVDRYRIVPKIRKRVRYTRKFFAHDEKEVANMGDLVMITPCQRLSRHKHFMLREIIRPKGQL
jgi:small subunit ribosomal protein S17